MFSSAVMDRFVSPRNSGELPDATHCGLDGIPGDGPYTQIWLQVSREQIAKASFETYPCPAAVACASLTAEIVTGKEVQFASGLEAHDIIALLGGLPEGKEHCAHRSIRALRSALNNPTQ